MIRPFQNHAAGRGAGTDGAVTQAPRLLLVAAALATAAATVAPARSAATASAGEPEALAHARVIRAEVSDRYRPVPGRRLVVTEATGMGVETLTLVTDWLDPHVLPARDGIYFEICSVRATCPYPARSAAWPAGAFLPRRQAVELALRAFSETSASLVVVSLPTTRPRWLVFERDDVLTALEPAEALARLAPDPAVADAPLRELVHGLTRPRLFVPLPFLPPPDDTFYAVRAFGP